MNSVSSYFLKKNASRKVDLIKDFFKKKETVLDFGCGDLTFAEILKKNKSFLAISGLDVIDFNSKVKNIPFFKYDGKKLPFKNNTFETVIAFYVLHHCDDIWFSLKECLRVAKKRVIVVEPISRYSFEKYIMGILDFVYNLWKIETIPLTYQFFPIEEWRIFFKKNKFKVRITDDVKKSVLALIPVGKIYIFEILKSP